ncbi:MAG: cohesin domain-containing protein [Burkholderiales bacterium]
MSAARFGGVRRLFCLAVIALVGCAAPQAHREGEALVAQGHFEEGMQRLAQALRAEPNNARYRSAMVVARERAVYDWLNAAERAFAAGDTLAAENWYRRVFAAEPDNVRAREGLERLQRQAHSREALADAQARLNAGDAAGALRRLREVLALDPGHLEAARLAREAEASLTRAPLEPELAAALKKPITLEFRDAPIRQIFEILSRTSNLNFVLDRDVRADLRASIAVRDAGIESILRNLMLTTQLEYRVLDAQSILIYPNTPAKAREYQVLAGRVFFLATADARQVVNTIRTIVRTRDIAVDERQNMIVMRDTPEALAIAERLVALHDQPEPEVMLEVEVLEIRRNRLLDLGITWPGSLALAPLATAAGAPITVNQLRNISGATLGATIGATTIAAGRGITDVTILANPRIRARNREKARIVVGDRVPNITTTSTATGFVAESIQYIDVGLKLDVEPTIHPDDEVSMRVALEVSSTANAVTTRSGTQAFQISTRNATAVLRLKSGENQVLAGLIRDEDRADSNRVPFLGDIPILGRLFGGQRDQNDKTEIVLSITPRVIRSARRALPGDAEFAFGTESSLRGRTFDAPLPPLAGVAPAAVAGAPGAAQPAAGLRPTVTLQGPAQVRVGGTFTMQVAMQSAEPIASFPVFFNYDSKLLEAVSVSEGPFLRQGGGRTNFSSRIDSSAGQVVASIARADEGGATGVGAVVTVVFRALAASPAARIELGPPVPEGPGGRLIGVPAPAAHNLAILPP